MANPERQRVRSVKADVAGDFAALDAALKDVTRELGPVYLLINNAGTSIPRRFVEADLKESREGMLAVDIKRVKFNLLIKFLISYH